MLMYGLLTTVLGMGAVFAFLLLLMWAIEATSFIVLRTQNKTGLDKVAAVIAIALKKRGDK